MLNIAHINTGDLPRDVNIHSEMPKSIKKLVPCYAAGWKLVPQVWKTPVPQPS